VGYTASILRRHPVRADVLISLLFAAAGSDSPSKTLTPFPKGIGISVSVYSPGYYIDMDKGFVGFGNGKYGVSGDAMLIINLLHKLPSVKEMVMFSEDQLEIECKSCSLPVLIK
jgi:hypothetical protein